MEAVREVLVLEVSFFNKIPTIHVESDVWAEFNIQTRMGMIETVECAVAGPGNILARIQIVADTGCIIADFDGITGKLEVIE